MVRKRDKYYDILIAIAIFFVIGNHTMYLADLDALSKFSVDLLVLQITKCAVPIFIALSGYLLANKNLTNSKEYFKFLKHQIPKVYIPMMLFSIPFILDNGFNIRSILGRTILAGLGAYKVFYFVPLICQFYFLLPLYQKYGTRCWFVWLNIIVSFIGISSIVYFNSILNLDIPLYLYAGPFPSWCIFFCIGLLIRKQSVNISKTFSLIASIIFLVLSYYISYLGVVYDYNLFGIKLSVFIFSVFLILLLLSSGTQKWVNTHLNSGIKNIFGEIGRLSFNIYLTHIFIIYWFKQHGYIHNWYLEWILVFLISVILAKLATVLPERLQLIVGIPPLKSKLL